MPDSVPDHPSIAGAILAGGRAHRLGGVNKAAIRIGGRRIIDRQLALLRQVTDSVFIVSGRPNLFADLGVPVVGDLLPNAGALGGIHAAIAQSPAARTIVVACDMPFLSVELLQRLARPSAADVIIPRTARGYEPLCAAWSAACAEPIRRRIEHGTLKAALVLDDLRVEELGPDVLASCDPHGLLFVNVNTAHDCERAQELSDLESDE